LSLFIQAQRVNVALLLRYIWHGVYKGIVLLRQVLIIKAIVLYPKQVKDSLEISIGEVWGRQL